MLPNCRENGPLVEEGNHDFLLMNEDDLYRRLWNLQTMDLLPDVESA